jgi:hypothetical protein
MSVLIINNSIFMYFIIYKLWTINQTTTNSLSIFVLIHFSLQIPLAHAYLKATQVLPPPTRVKIAAQPCHKYFIFCILYDIVKATSTALPNMATVHQM